MEIPSDSTTRATYSSSNPAPQPQRQARRILHRLLGKCPLRIRVFGSTTEMVPIILLLGGVGNSKILASAYESGINSGWAICGGRLHSRPSSREPSIWLETGEAVDNIFSNQTNSIAIYCTIYLWKR